MNNSIQSDLIRGHINTIILKALFDADRYGYDIVREIEQKSSGQYKLKQPTLYSCLKRLEVQGFIRSYWGAKSNGGRRKYYTLTDMGRELFIKNQTEWEYSRTVIDKLISDKDFDLSTVISEDSDADFDEVAENETDSDAESDIADEASADAADTLPSTDSENESVFADTNDIADTSESTDTYANAFAADTFISQTDEETEKFEDDAFPDIDKLTAEALKEKQQENLRNYIDTTALMNELFDNQSSSASGASYSTKLMTEEYSPANLPDLNAQNYFNDAYLFEDDDELLDAKQESDSRPAFDNHQNEQYEQYVAPSRSETVYADAAPQYKEEVQQEKPQYEKPLFFQDDEDVTESYSSPKTANFERNFQAADDEPEEEKPSYQFESYNKKTQTQSGDEGKQLIDREYKNILGSLLESGKPASPPPQEKPEKPAATALLDDDMDSDDDGDDYSVLMGRDDESAVNKRIQARNFNKISENVRNLGDGIKIRTHSNESSKSYNASYYYYSNKLMKTHYMTLFIIMLVEIAAVFAGVFYGLGSRPDGAMWLYIIAVLFAAAFPIVAFALNIKSPDKRKRINFEFRNSMIFRILIMLLGIVTVYLVNLLFGMPTFIGTEYANYFILPALLCINFPISSIIFNSLYKSGKYSVDA